MSWAQWYELRVAGSAGTRAGIASGSKEGIAIGENGRLCALPQGPAKRFATEEEAMNYLAQTSIPGLYRFEAVLCRYAPPATVR